MKGDIQMIYHKRDRMGRRRISKKSKQSITYARSLQHRQRHRQRHQHHQDHHQDPSGSWPYMMIIG